MVRQPPRRRLDRLVPSGFAPDRRKSSRDFNRRRTGQRHRSHSRHNRIDRSHTKAISRSSGKPLVCISRCPIRGCIATRRALSLSAKRPGTYWPVRTRAGHFFAKIVGGLLHERPLSECQKKPAVQLPLSGERFCRKRATSAPCSPVVRQGKAYRTAHVSTDAHPDQRRLA